MKNSIVNDGKYLTCRLCKNEIDKAYYNNNKIKWKDYKLKNHEKVKAVQKKANKKYNSREDVKLRSRKRYELIKHDPSYIKKRKEYREANKEKKIIIDRAYRDKNKERIALTKKQYLKNLPPEVLMGRMKIKADKARKRLQENIKNLSDSYVKGNITNRSRLYYSDIPDSLVELKRVQIQLRRELKKLKGDDNVNTNS